MWKGSTAASTTDQAVSDPFSQALLRRYDERFPGSAKFTAGSASTGLYRGLKLWQVAVKEAGTLEQAAVIRALDHARIAEGPGGPAEMMPGQHHLRLNMNVGQVRGTDEGRREPRHDRSRRARAERAMSQEMIDEALLPPRLHYQPARSLFVAESDPNRHAGDRHLSGRAPPAGVRRDQSDALVPVLEDGDFRLTESSAILKYLADKFDSPLYPKDLRQRARVNERMDWFNTQLSRDFCFGLVFAQLLPHHKRRSDEARAPLCNGARSARRSGCRCSTTTSLAPEQLRVR